MAKKKFPVNLKNTSDLSNKINKFNKEKITDLSEEEQNEYQSMLTLGYKLIDYELIDPNPDNHFPINNLDMTTYTMEEYGLFHNIVLHKLDNGRYKIISGERRYLAIGEGRKKCAKENKPIPLKYQKILARIIDASTLDQKIVLRLANLDVRDMTPITRRKQVLELTQLLQEKNKLAKGKADKVNIANMIAKTLKLERRQIFKYQKINRSLIEELIFYFDREELKVDQAEKIASYPIELQYQIWDLFKEDQSIDIDLIQPNSERQKELVTKKLEEKKLELKTFDEMISNENILTEDEILSQGLHVSELENQVNELEKALIRLNKIEDKEIETQYTSKILGRLTNTYNKMLQNAEKVEKVIDKIEPDDKKKIIEELDKLIEKLENQKNLLKN